MDKQSLTELVEISCAVGSREDYVQAGGGNTSVKSSDGRSMAIKASGTALTAMSESAGWVEVDVAAVLSIFEKKELATLETDAREARVLKHFSSAIVGGGGRPSVETALHAMLGRFVIHTHPVAANALNCGPGLKALQELTPKGEFPPLWVPYTDPGWRLAATIKSAAEAYEREHGKPPVVLFMENHGLLVCASEAKACVALHGEWVSRCERYFQPGVKPLRAPQPVDSPTLRQAMVQLRKGWRAAKGNAPFARLAAGNNYQVSSRGL